MKSRLPSWLKSPAARPHTPRVPAHRTIGVRLGAAPVELRRTEAVETLPVAAAAPAPSPVRAGASDDRRALRHRTGEAETIDADDHLRRRRRNRVLLQLRRPEADVRDDGVVALRRAELPGRAGEVVRERRRQIVLLRRRRLPLLRRAGEEDRVRAVEEDARRDELRRLAAAEVTDAEPVARHRHFLPGDLNALPPLALLAMQERADASRQKTGRVLARRGRAFADGHDVGPAVAVDIGDDDAAGREAGG